MRIPDDVRTIGTALLSAAAATALMLACATYVSANELPPGRDTTPLEEKGGGDLFAVSKPLSPGGPLHSGTTPLEHKSKPLPIGGPLKTGSKALGPGGPLSSGSQQLSPGGPLQSGSRPLRGSGPLPASGGGALRGGHGG